MRTSCPAMNSHINMTFVLRTRWWGKPLAVESPFSEGFDIEKTFEPVKIAADRRLRNTNQGLRPYTVSIRKRFLFMERLTSEMYSSADTAIAIKLWLRTLRILCSILNRNQSIWIEKPLSKLHHYSCCPRAHARRNSTDLKYRRQKIRTTRECEKKIFFRFFY
jgi:hypothetical protein